MDNILQLIQNGNFSAALEAVNNISAISEEDALAVSISVVNVCINCIPGDRLDEDNMILLLKTVLKHVKDLSDSDLLKYCQTIFYVLKYFTDRKSFTNALKIEEFLTATFLVTRLSSEANDIKPTYCSIIINLSNSVIRLSQSKENVCAAQLIKFCEMILRLSHIVKSKSAVLESGRSLLSAFITLQIDAFGLINFYQYVMELIDLDGILGSIDSYLSIVQSLIKYFMKKNSFQELRLMLCESRLIFSEEIWQNLHSVFDIVLIWCPDYTISDKHVKKFKGSVAALRTLDSTMYIRAMQFMEWPLHHLGEFYRTDDSVWCNLPSDKILKILAVTSLFNNNSKQVREKQKICGCVPACSSQTHYFFTIQLGSNIVNLIRTYCEKHKNCSEEFYLEQLSFMDSVWALIESSKSDNCSNWSKYFINFSYTCYNLSTLLYKQGNPFRIRFYKRIAKYHFKYYDGHDGIFDQILFRISQHYFNENDIENAMTFTALRCLLFSKQQNLNLNSWFLTKKKIKDDPKNAHYQEWTLVSALEQNTVLINDIVESNLNISKEDKIELLRFELNLYKTKYPSKLPMMITFKQLSELADLETIATTIIEIFGEGNTALHADIHLVFHETSKRLQKEVNIKGNHLMQLALAVLFYYKYKNSFEGIAKKNIEVMEKTMIVNKKDKVIEGVPVDANDECDIVSAYKDLRLNTLTSILADLDQSLTLLTFIAKSAVNDFKFAGVAHELATRIGFEYKIHRYGIRSLQAFETSLTFANISQNPGKQLISLSYLIENGNIDSDLGKELAFLAENLEFILRESNDKESNDRVLVTYYICKAKAYLYKDNGVARDSCKRAEVLLSKNVDFEVLKAEWLILMYKLSKSCEFGDEHIKEPMTAKLHKANDVVIEKYRLSGNAMSPHEKCIFFDTQLELVKTYYLMKLAREVRAYGKHVVTVAQKLLLPLRCVEFLLILARTDLMCCKFDQCMTKLSGINDIFCTPSCAQNSPALKDLAVQKFEKKAEFLINTLDKKMQGLTLELPRHSRQFSPGSPTLSVEGYKEPPFLSHEISCLCFSCTCSEQQLLLLQKIGLDARINSYEQQNKLAKEFFRGAVNLYNKLKRYFTLYKEKSNIFVAEGLIIENEEVFLETYATILLDYSFHLRKTGCKVEASAINLELLQILRPKKVQFTYVYSEALVQREGYLMPTSVVEPDIICLIDDVDEAGDTLQKTPESRQNCVKIDVSNRKKTQSQGKKRPIRKANLFENYVMDSASSLKRLNTAKPNSTPLKNSKLFFTESTPLLQARHAPVNTPKIQIYTDVEKSTRKARKKAVEITKSPFKPTDLSRIPEIKEPLVTRRPDSRKKDETEDKPGPVPFIKTNLLEWGQSSGRMGTYSRPMSVPPNKQSLKVYSDEKETSSEAAQPQISNIEVVADNDNKKTKTTSKSKNDESSSTKPNRDTSKSVKEIKTGCSASSKSGKTTKMAEPSSSVKDINKKLWVRTSEEKSSSVSDPSLDFIEQSPQAAPAKTNSTRKKLIIKHHERDIDDPTKAITSTSVKSRITKVAEPSTSLEKIKKNLWVDSSSEESSSVLNTNLDAIEKSPEAVATKTKSTRKLPLLNRHENIESISSDDIDKGLDHSTKKLGSLRIRPKVKKANGGESSTSSGSSKSTRTQTRNSEKNTGTSTAGISGTNGGNVRKSSRNRLP